MSPFIEVRFSGLEQDPSVESAIHRWVARLEAMHLEIHRGRIVLEPSGRRRTAVFVTLAMTDGTVRTATTVHPDVDVGVADAFRSIRQETSLPARPPRARALALAG